MAPARPNHSRLGSVQHCAVRCGHVASGGLAPLAERAKAHLSHSLTQVIAILKLHSGEPTEAEWLALGSPECQLSRSQTRGRHRRPSLGPFHRKKTNSIVEGVEGLSLFSLTELNNARKSGDPVHMMANRIHRTLVSRYTGAKHKCPAPIWNRVYQELSEALRCYDAAYKIKSIPVPFGFVRARAAHTRDSARVPHAAS